MTTEERIRRLREEQRSPCIIGARWWILKQKIEELERKIEKEQNGQPTSSAENTAV